MTGSMRQIGQSAHVGSTELAGALLRAWAQGNPAALGLELDRSSQANCESDTCEQERLQLLSAVSDTLRNCSSPFSPDTADPAVEVCIRLLSHLAGAPAPARPAWSSLRVVIRSEKPGSACSKSARREISTRY